ncbi:hypothetical protein CCHR01_19536 [Colletotrichum chrysophilum]|uniref:Uncharacterized protein n=1 Tax=Colletotrichum chrysophilum TaxID=1836956 RepID=A0AAD9EAB6_9PEZI|nr:hypothetical protein CCHR01_19536 [Colletotrichum chrysophilum]
MRTGNHLETPDDAFVISHDGSRQGREGIPGDERGGKHSHAPACLRMAVRLVTPRTALASAVTVSVSPVPSPPPPSPCVYSARQSLLTRQRSTRAQKVPGFCHPRAWVGGGPFQQQTRPAPSRAIQESGLVFLDRGWIDALSLVLILPGPCLAKERSLHSPMPGSLQQDNTTIANQLSHRTGPGRWEKKVGGVGMVVVDCH